MTERGPQHREGYRHDSSRVSAIPRSKLASVPAVRAGAEALGESPTPSERHGRAGVAGTLLGMLATGLGYYAGATIGFGFRVASIPTSIFWLPNSLVFAVLLLVPPRRWWLYVLAAFPAHVAMALQNDVPLTTMLLLFATNVGDGALAAFAVRRFARGRDVFDGFRDVVVFVIFAVIAPFLVSFLDAGASLLTGWADDYWTVWHTRFRSNVLTNLIWVPALVIACTRGLEWLKRAPARRCFEAAFLALCLAVVGSFVFGPGRSRAGNLTGLIYAPLPLFLWAAARFGTGGVSAALVGFALLVIHNAMRGHGPFSSYPPAANILALQVLLTLLATPLLLLAALLQDQRRGEEALRDREAQYRSIFESASDGVLITDLEHNVVMANPAFCQLTGYGLSELREVHPRNFFHLDDLRPFDTYLNRATSGEMIAVGAMCVRRDGGLSHFEVHGRRFSYGGQPHVLSVVRDVTEREYAFQLLEQRVSERTRALSTLLEISNTVASTLELKPLLNVVLEQLQIVVEYTGATILIEEDEEFVIGGHRGPLSSDEVSRLRVPAVDWTVVRRDTPLIIGDLRGDSPVAAAFRAATGEALSALSSYARSLLIVPLKARDRVIGLLLIGSSEADQYTVHDAQLAWALANQAAVAIENAELYDQARELAAFEERQRLARDLHDSVTQTLHAIAMAGDRLPRLWERDQDEGRRAVSRLREMSQIAFAELRTLLVELRPIELVEGDLGDLVCQLAEALRSRLSVPVLVELDGMAKLAPDVQVALYRVAQEALSNISKHAVGASSIEVHLRCSKEEVELRVRDDGAGFEPASVPTGHLGLGIMHERARAIGASLSIESAPQRGTTVTIRWRQAPNKFERASA